MYHIIEKVNHNGIYFEKQEISDENKIINIDFVQIRNSKVNFNGKIYSYLYDSKMNPISLVFHYLNYEIGKRLLSPNDVTTAMSALKLLYAFMELFGLDLETLTENDANNFIEFLEGISKEGTFISINFITRRKNSTINTYLPFVRKYITYLKIKDSIFSSKSGWSKKIYIPDSETYIEVPEYDISVNSYDPETSTPMYINIDEYKRILEIVRKEYSIREECLIRLMFELGFRIGEALGLTNEDLITNDTITDIYVRNRCSDRFDQLAKTCMNVKNPQQYLSRQYKTKNTGFQVVIANNNLIDIIYDYINEYHVNPNRKFRDNYNRYTIADNVNNTYGKIKSENFYIFINSLGKPLTANLWNNTQREIFKKAGLALDIGCKETNLNHRCRHGFAMFMIHYNDIKIQDLMLLMRHRSIRSTLKYYRPTPKDIIKLKTNYVESIYDVIPELSIKGKY